MSSAPGPASWLQLTLTPGLGASTVRRMLRQFGLPEAVLARPRSELRAFAPQAALAALDSDEVAQAVARALAWLETPGCSLVTLADDTYPGALLEIGDPPP